MKIQRVGLSASDVLDMGIKMELDGALFYQKAANATNNPSQRKMLVSLSRMEVNHEKNFIEIKERLLKKNLPAGKNQSGKVVSEFLGSWVKGKVFSADPAKALRLADQGDIKSILKKAIEMEKDAISFYTGMRAYLGDADAEGLIGNIILEEISHVVLLSKALEKVK